MREQVRDYKNLVKVDDSFVVNLDEAAYVAAKKRMESRKKQTCMESRVDSLEQKMDSILNMLSRMIKE